MSIPDVFLCPKRFAKNVEVPAELVEKHDVWVPDIWPIRLDVVWNAMWKPRVCSFCLSVHPTDVLRLLREGWYTYDTTMPEYKYMIPTGQDWLPDPNVLVYLPHINESEVHKVVYRNELVNSEVQHIFFNVRRRSRQI